MRRLLLRLAGQDIMESAVITTIPGGALPLGLVVRSIRPDDWSRLQEFHRRLSGDTIRSRYFGPHRELSEHEARRFTSLPAVAEAALVAIVEDRIVGVGRYIRLGSGIAAEVAFVVEDGYQGHGIGRVLLDLLAGIGWRSGIRRFVADTLVANRAMLDVFMHTPAAVTVLTTRRDGSVVHLVMGITKRP